MTAQGMRKLAAELFGTFALVFAGTGVLACRCVQEPGCCCRVSQKEA
jgi:glycerol uptake facilitator-like aquaporin